MAKYGFNFDAENCVGCRTCQVACKDINDLPVGTNYRFVRTFLTGSGYKPCRTRRTARRGRLSEKATSSWPRGHFLYTISMR